MKKRILGIFLLVVFVSSIVSSCKPSGLSESTALPSPTPTEIPKITLLRLAELYPLGYPTTQGDMEFAKLVRRRTNGRINIVVNSDGGLGTEKEVIEKTQSGEIDFARVSTSSLTASADVFNVLFLPYLFRDSNHMYSVLEGDIGYDLLNSVEKDNIIGLCFYNSGARSFYNNKKEIKTIADMKGLKIRVPPSDLMMILASSLGAVGTQMDMQKVYGALSAGELDGAENNLLSYLASEHYQVAKYLTLDEHCRVPEIIIASKSSLSKLSPEDQDIIKNAAKDSVAVQKAAWQQYEAESLARLKGAGCTVTQLDENTWAEFRKAVTPVYKKLGNKYKDLIEKIQNTN